jgi:hypothetical protein
MQPRDEKSPDQDPREPSTIDKAWPTRRYRKEMLLPQIVQLALEGQTGSAMARILGIPPRTVGRWLRAMRGEWLAAATESGLSEGAVALTALDRAYCQAMEACRKTPESEMIQTGSEGGHAAGESTQFNRPPRGSLYDRLTSLMRGSIQFLRNSARAAGTPPPRPTEQRRRREVLERMTFEELHALNDSLKAERGIPDRAWRGPNHAGQTTSL